MDYVRIGGVCLLLMLLAAALPGDVLAQASQSSSEAAPSISPSLLSGSSAQESTISAETLSKRNTGLKPLGSRSSSTTSAAAASEPSKTLASNAPAAAVTQKEAAAPAAATAAATPATISQVSTSAPVQTASSEQAASAPAESSATQTESRSATTSPAENTITPDQIDQETATVGTAASRTPGRAKAGPSRTPPCARAPRPLGRSWSRRRGGSPSSRCRE